MGQVVKSRLWAAALSRSARPWATGAPRSGQLASAYLPAAGSAALGLVIGTAGLGLEGLGRVAVLVASLAALALAAASAAAVRRRLVRPLHHLAEVAAAAVTAREPSSPLDPRAPALSVLSTAIDSLATEVDRGRRSVLAASILEGSSDLTVILDGGGRIRHASAAAGPMLGRPAEWQEGQLLAGLAHPEDRAQLEDLLGRAGEAGHAQPVEVRFSHLHGHWVPTDVGRVDLHDDPPVTGTVLNVRDVTSRKRNEQDLLRRALYDPLTGLANRALFREHVEKALARLRRTTARPHAVLFVDLDGFKTVNDSLGHAAGDEVLVEVGHRLGRVMRPGDTAARLGGDEFAVLLENPSEREAVELAHQILKVLLLPIVVQGKEVVLSGSIGIALSDTGADADELLRNADVAMYTAKAAGKSQFAVFQPAMHHAALRRLDLEADLRRAIESQELFLTYQPIFELATRRLVGVEVLVRWQHPQRGLIQPLDFIPLAEDSGLIRPLGRFILGEACRQAQDWWHRHPDHRPLRLCVNASVRQIEDPSFHDEVAAALARSGFDGRNLTLEITESLFMDDVQATVHKLCRLKELGLKLAVDDFGTGYSSLSYLRSLPVDILKIDKSFVAGVTGGVEQSAVAHAVVKLARTFNLQTVAEGIEQPEQAAQLQTIGADMGQGYWFSRPLTAPMMDRFLTDERDRHLVVRPPLADVRS